MNVFGITGWKNSGKTGVMERLVAEIVARGFSVSTVKHAHHSFDVDHEGRDSYRHRQAGAREVLLSSGHRWALMHELRGQNELALSPLLAKMDPVDLVLIEGFKQEPHAKIECYRHILGKAQLNAEDPTICALATDVEMQVSLPTFGLEETLKIADFVLRHVGLQP